MSSLKKVLLKNTTKMSLHERFTAIRTHATRSTTTAADRVREQLASSKNRRLALQLEQRAGLAAASPPRKRETTRAANIRERLSLPRGFSARRRGGRAGFLGLTTWKSPMLRNQRRTRLGGDNGSLDSPDGPSRRSRSPFPGRTPMGSRRSRSRARSQSRSRVGSQNRSRASSQNRSRANSQNRSRARSSSRSQIPDMNRSRSPFRPRGSGRPRGIRGGGGFRGRGRGFYKSEGFNGSGFRGGRGTFRGRGRGRGNRGRGRGFGNSRGGGIGYNRGRKGPDVSKEALDMDLDEYMSSTKANLDKDMDTYMSEEKWD